MNFIKHYTKLALFAAVVMMSINSCNNKPAEAPKPAGEAAVENLKIRYIDEDSIMANYNLAKDLNEAVLRRQNQYDAAERQRGSEINKFESAIQQKLQNNQYLDENTYKADQAKLQRMYTDAQNYLANLQQSYSNEAYQSQLQLNDSIDNFMKDYAKKKGFDMVLRKSATLFIDEKYDVTKEVIEGLNKRYNKVGGKVAPARAKAPEAAPTKTTEAPKLSTEKPATPGKVDLKKKD